MASKEARERRLKEIQEIAAGWGKIIAAGGVSQRSWHGCESGRHGGVGDGGLSGIG